MQILGSPTTAATVSRQDGNSSPQTHGSLFRNEYQQACMYTVRASSLPPLPCSCLIKPIQVLRTIIFHSCSCSTLTCLKFSSSPSRLYHNQSFPYPRSYRRIHFLNSKSYCHPKTRLPVNPLQTDSENATNHTASSVPTTIPVRETVLAHFVTGLPGSRNREDATRLESRHASAATDSTVEAVMDADHGRLEKGVDSVVRGEKEEPQTGSANPFAGGVEGGVTYMSLSWWSVNTLPSLCFSTASVHVTSLLLPVNAPSSQF